MLIIALVCAGSSAVLLLTTLYYFRIGFKKGTVILLWAVRALIILALLCAFFQPVFKIRTIAPKDRGTIVLLDVSKSMRLFNADSSISRFLAALTNLSSGKPRLRCGPDGLFWRFNKGLRTRPTHILFR